MKNINFFITKLLHDDIHIKLQPILKKRVFKFNSYIEENIEQSNIMDFIQDITYASEENIIDNLK